MRGRIGAKREPNLGRCDCLHRYCDAVIADTYYYGAALLLGTILFTQHAHKRRWANILLMIPVVHAWVVARVVADYTIYDLEIAGFVMLIESLGLSWASWQMWDFEWDEWSDQQVQEFSNNSGIAGALIFIPAAWLLVLGGEDSALWLFGGMLCVHSAGQAQSGSKEILGGDESMPWLESPLDSCAFGVILTVEL